MRLRKKGSPLPPEARLRYAVINLGATYGRELALEYLKTWVDVLEDPTSPESLTLDVFGKEAATT